MPKASGQALPPTLTPMANAAGETPLVFLPDLGGNVMYARKILPHLSGRVAAFGMRFDRDMIGRLELASLAEIGDRFAADLIASPLAPPYRLVGHSFAGLVAYETACGLARQGVDPGGGVAAVILLDTGLPRHLCALKGAPVGQALYRLRETAKFAFQTARDAWIRRRAETGRAEILAAKGYLRIDLKGHPESYRFILKGLYRAMIEYQPSRYPGGVTVLRATSRKLPAGYPPDFGWGRYADGGVRMLDIATDHLAMVREDAAAAQTALRIGELLAEARLAGLEA